MTTNNVIWKENDTPVSNMYGDVYYSEINGLEESSYVYLEHNNLKERFGTVQHFQLVEFGFGTGLNFLNTQRLWQENCIPGSMLNYYAVEGHPLCSHNIRRALTPWADLLPGLDHLIQDFSILTTGVNHLIYGNINLYLFIGDVINFLPRIPRNIDAWFLDGFSPQVNPEMWSDAIFSCMAENSVHEATFSTYSASSMVAEKLNSHGFSVKKVNGFARKREMLCGSICQMK